jgi:hypothetical protein
MITKNSFYLSNEIVNNLWKAGLLLVICSIFLVLISEFHLTFFSILISLQLIFFLIIIAHQMQVYI